MPRNRRIPWAAMLAVCLGGLMTLAYAAPSLQERKQQVVTKALGNCDAAHARAILAATPSASALLDMTLSSTPGETTLTLHTTGNPECRIFDLDSGKRVVVDLNNTINLQAGRTLSPSGAPLISAVRTSLFAVEPSFISRIVFDLTVPCAFRLVREDQCVKIHLRSRLRQTVSLEPEVPAAEHVRALPKERVTALVRQLEELLDDQAIVFSAHALLRDMGKCPVMAESETVNVPVALLPDASSGTDIPLSSADVIEAEAIAAPEEQSDLSERLAMLTTQLEAVSETAFDIRPALSAQRSFVDAQTTEAQTPADDATEEALDESAAADAQPAAETAAVETPEAAEDEIVPPAPREDSLPETAEANVSIVKMLQQLAGIDAEGGETPGIQTEDAPKTLAVSEVSAPKPKPYTGDPLLQLVNVDFREMELSNVVALLAHKAGINVIAGTDLSGTVTANLTRVPLIQAMQTALRMNGLGMLEEEGIYRIVTYEEAISAQRTTVMVTLQNAKAEDVEKVITDILKGSRDQRLFSISSNKPANVVVIAGPESRIGDLVRMAHDLDITEPVLPTVTEPIKLNYADAQQLAPMIEKMLTPEIGNVAADERARHLVVTDVPVVVEQVRQLVKQLDIPVKQVILDTMVVDALLNDTAETGVNWLLSAVQSQNARQAMLGDDGRAIGTIQDLSLASALPMANPAGALAFSLLTSDIDWRGIIQAEVRNRNGNLVSNPVLVTVENKEAKISISQEIPYTELSQTSAGGSQTNTQFKDIGTILTVTPRVTHDNHIIVDIEGKESGTAGEFNGVPIESKRQLQSTLRMMSGQTIFIGGLRKSDRDTTIRKLPILGDIPLVNFAFKTNKRTEQVNELMIFLTCTVLEDEMPDPSPYHQQKFEEANDFKLHVDAQRGVLRDVVRPDKMRDPAWKWRRAN